MWWFFAGLAGLMGLTAFAADAMLPHWTMVVLVASWPLWALYVICDWADQKKRHQRRAEQFSAEIAKLTRQRDALKDPIAQWQAAYNTVSAKKTELEKQVAAYKAQLATSAVTARNDALQIGNLQGVTSCLSTEIRKREADLAQANERKTYLTSRLTYHETIESQRKTWATLPQGYGSDDEGFASAVAAALK